MSHKEEKHQTTAMKAPPIATTSGGTNLKRGQTQATEPASSGKQVAGSCKPSEKNTSIFKLASQSSNQQQQAKTQQTKLVANLHSAADEGKVELVRLLLRCGADVNAQDDEVSC